MGGAEPRKASFDRATKEIVTAQLPIHIALSFSVPTFFIQREVLMARLRSKCNDSLPDRSVLESEGDCIDLDTSVS
jgi:hypothetical protein